MLQRERLTRDESTKSGCGVVEQSKKLGINESGRGRSSLSLFDERTGQGKSCSAQAVRAAAEVAAQTVMCSPVVSGACDEQGKGGSGSWKGQEDQRQARRLDRNRKRRTRGRGGPYVRGWLSSLQVAADRRGKQGPG